METNLRSYLKGFGTFGRSFNRSVLVNDESIQHAYKNALNNGIGECNRLRTVIVGDKGVGKTSTLQMLTGGQCDPTIEPNSTEGIDITTCETSDLTPEWSKATGTLRSDDPKLSAAWLVCKDEDSFEGALKMGVKSDSSQKKRVHRTLKRKGHTPAQQTSVEEQFGITNIISKTKGSCEALWLQLKWTFPLIIMIVSVANRIGFGPFILTTMVSTSPSFDLNNGYRFGTACALQAILVDIVSTDMVIGITGDMNVDFLVGSLRVLLCCFAAGVFGFLFGFGGRTGVAIAVCLMTRPELQTDSDYLYQKAPHIFLLCIGNLIGVAFVKLSESSIRSLVYWLLQKKLLLLVSCFILSLQQVFLSLNGSYFYSLFIGFVMGMSCSMNVQYARTFIAKMIWRDGYITKKAIGFITTIVLGHLVGLKMNNRLGWLEVVCIASFIAKDLYTCYQVLKAQANGIPIHIFRDQLMTSSRGQDGTIMKLVVWDFAGDSVYQVMQHCFLPERAIYTLVFSLEAAYENQKHQIEKLKQWLHSIKAHSEAYNALVFIVGTHRDSVINHIGFLRDFAEQLKQSLYADFCSLLAINEKYESLLFVVENSRPIDEDGILLRETIKQKARERPFLKQEQPIWYLRLLKMIKQWKSESNSSWFMKRSFLVDEACRHGFAEEDVESFLTFCHFSGEFIYRNDDHVMKNYVILDPQHLLDIMTELLKFPPLSERCPEAAESWEGLQANGVASRDLLSEIVGEHQEMVNMATRFLEAYNMLLPIKPGDESNFTHCIVPSRLPEDPGSGCVWDSDEDDEEYFFDFGYVPSEAIFHRLLARCWYHDQGETHTNSKLYKQRGIFCFKEGSIFFMLELQKDCIKQQLIKVVVQSSDKQQRCGFQVLKWMNRELQDIKKKDFPNLPYKSGPWCKICSEGQDTITVLQLYANGDPFPAANSPVKTFLVNGRYHEVCLAPKLTVSCGRKNRRSSSESSLSSATGDNGRQQLEGTVEIEGSHNVVIKVGDNAQINLRNPHGEIPSET